jgi:hypothetical protein
MHRRKKNPGSVQFSLDKRSVENEFCRVVAELRLPPRLNLVAPCGLKASLNTINTHCKRVDQVEAFRMLRQDRSKVSAECHV